MCSAKGLKSIAEFIRNETVGQVVPDLPAEGRALLLCWHDVRVRHVNPPRFRLQQNKTQRLLVHIDVWRFNTDVQNIYLSARVLMPKPTPNSSEKVGFNAKQTRCVE